MFGLFKCKHPFRYLGVEKQHTKGVKDSDFELIDYHLFCQECSKILTLKHARMIGGVDAFMKRGREGKA